MIIFKLLRYKNILSTGNVFTEIKLNSSKNTLIIGSNGAGKCVCINTPIKIQNNMTGEIIETTIGKFYEQEKQNNTGKN